mmetsp:Transcript_64408/g.149818  ORF Transcript_64408/g.149818 Transcript_64408/m.149818 type:complete len:365 (-) Transcript_64408:16-1110(-)
MDAGSFTRWMRDWKASEDSTAPMGHLTTPQTGNTFEGVWNHGRRQNTIRGSTLYWQDGLSTELEVAKDHLVMELDGEVFHAHLDAREQQLMWSDGDVWARAAVSLDERAERVTSSPQSQSCAVGRSTSRRQHGTYYAGDHVKYWSSTLAKWIKAIVKLQRMDGTVELDVKKHAKPENLRWLHRREAASLPPKADVAAAQAALGCLDSQAEAQPVKDLHGLLPVPPHRFVGTVSTQLPFAPATTFVCTEEDGALEEGAGKSQSGSSREDLAKVLCRQAAKWEAMRLPALRAEWRQRWGRCGVVGHRCPPPLSLFGGESGTGREGDMDGHELIRHGLIAALLAAERSLGTQPQMWSSDVLECIHQG